MNEQRVTDEQQSVFTAMRRQAGAGRAMPSSTPVPTLADAGCSRALRSLPSDDQPGPVS
jgi:hypothetical protein